MNARIAGLARPGCSRRFGVIDGNGFDAASVLLFAMLRQGRRPATGATRRPVYALDRMFATEWRDPLPPA